MLRRMEGLRFKDLTLPYSLSRQLISPATYL